MEIQTLHPVSTTQADRVSQSPTRFDWAMALAGTWLLGGLFLDGWAHHHIALETFFTPWHAVLYSGYAVGALLVAANFINGIRRGRSWRQALPAGYLPALVGAVAFFFGGLADFTWHTFLGIERSLDALLSPPHLVLALSAALLLTGPLRAAHRRDTLDFPGLLSLSLLLGLIAFFTEYLHPWFELLQADRIPDTPLGLRMNIIGNQPLMIGAVLLQSALFTGMALYALRRWKLPFGALTFLFAFPTGLGLAMLENLSVLPLVLVCGLAVDLLRLALRPTADHPAAVRIFAFLTPVVIYGLYFSAIQRFGSLTWPITLWTGTVLLAGIAGLLVSYTGDGSGGGKAVHE